MRVIGIGGIFFKAKRPALLANWYREHLGINIKDNVALFTWLSPVDPKRKGHTVCIPRGRCESKAYVPPEEKKETSELRVTIQKESPFFTNVYAGAYIHILAATMLSAYRVPGIA